MCHGSIKSLALSHAQGPSSSSSSSCFFGIISRGVLPRTPPHQCSFGYSVNVPLGSRSADPHSTAVWCGNLLHSSPQLQTAICCLCSACALFEHGHICSVEYLLLQPRSAQRNAQARLKPSSLHCTGFLCPSYTTTLCWAQNEHHGVGGLWVTIQLAWAPSIFGAARFGR